MARKRKVGRPKGSKNKKPKLGSGKRFAACVKRVKKKGAYYPEGLCAVIGRKKYGKKRMAEWAKKGKKRK